MKLAPKRFETYLTAIEQQLATASYQSKQQQTNAGLWLYLHDLRTPFFMLEALSRFYLKMSEYTSYEDKDNQKIFENLLERFKIIEDALGAVDFYAAFAKEFEDNPTIPVGVKNYIQQQLQFKLAELNYWLTDEGWLDGSRIAKIRKKLAKANFAKDKKETVMIEVVLESEIDKCLDFIYHLNGKFTKMEDEVHELRRKLRWVSIYAKALQGAIQLEKGKKTPDFLKAYQTEAIVKSPFNVLPEPMADEPTVALKRGNFFALSWLIAALGGIKDNGLRIELVKTALQNTRLLNDTDALAQTYALLGATTTEQLLEQANEAVFPFFEHKVLQGLLVR